MVTHESRRKDPNQKLLAPLLLTGIHIRMKTKVSSKLYL